MPYLRLIFLSGLFLSPFCNAKNGQIIYPEVAARVSYQQVTELPNKQPDKRIAYGKEKLQYGLLWLPETKPQKSLIVLIHGGCWLNAFGVDHTFAMATALSQAGYPVWSLEYRRTGDPGGGWPGSFEDIKGALQSIDKLKKHRVNTDSIILMGHSAGGHLALLAASALNDMDFEKIIGLAAITDISRYALGDNSCQRATIEFMSGLPNEQSQSYQAANLIYKKHPDHVILMQGEADHIVPLLQSQLPQTQRILLPKTDHFDWIHPGSPAFKVLLKTLVQ